MQHEDAWKTARVWIEMHGSAVQAALHYYHVPANDRPDLVQQVFSTAFLALSRDVPIENPRAWLLGVVRGHVKNFRRKRRGGALPLIEPEDVLAVIDPGAGPEVLVEARERVDRIFDELSPEAQKILLDVHREGMSFEEIARDRGVNLNRARYLYKKAVRQANEIERKLGARSRLPALLPLGFLHFQRSLGSGSGVGTGARSLESSRRRVCRSARPAGRPGLVRCPSRR